MLPREARPDQPGGHHPVSRAAMPVTARPPGPPGGRRVPGYDPGRPHRGGPAGLPGHTAAGRRANVAAATAAGDRSGRPGPPAAGRGPARPVVLRQVWAYPARGDDRHRGPARRRRPDTLSRCARGAARRLERGEAERLGMGPAVVLGQNLADLAWLVGDGAIADLAAGDRQMGDGHREAGGTCLVHHFYDARSPGMPWPCARGTVSGHCVMGTFAA